MSQHQSRRKDPLLWGLIVVALAFVLALHYLRTLTGNRALDGFMGVGLGLYICSHPAATAVDLLFFRRGALRSIGQGGSDPAYLALNAVVFLVGWYVIFASLTHLVGKTL